MRRTEFLLNEVRESTDNSEANAIKDKELIGYFNAGQKLIQNIIFKTNPKADIFKDVVDYEYSSVGEYELPDDIFAVNGLSLVQYKSGDQYCKIDRKDPSERGGGYYTRDNLLIIEGYNYNYPIRVTVFRKLPKMDKRWGKIQTVTANTSLVLEGTYDTSAPLVDDYVSVVDKFGVQKVKDIYIDTFTGATWATTNALTGVAIGDYVCMGENTVNASLLPDECETYLLDYVRQRIITRQNYEDGGKQVYFTDKQQSDIADLFKNNQKDNLIPPITDYDSFDYGFE